MSWSFPFHAFQLPFMSLTFSRYVRFIFHVCPVLSLRVISLHLPSCRVVSLCFVSLAFSLHSPCFHFCPLISLHFRAFPLCSPIFPTKNTVFPAFSQLGHPKPQSFPDFRQKEAGTPNQQRAGRGNRAWDPCFATPAPRRLRLVEHHQIAARYVGGRNPPVSRGGTKGGLSSILP